MKERPSFSVAGTHNRSSDISPPSVDFSLEELLRKLRRRKWLIFAFIAVATLLTAVVSLLLTSQYTATTRVLVTDHPATGLDFAAAAQGLPTDMAYMSSQVQVITSRNLASAVIDKLSLELDPEFNVDLQPKSAVAWLLDKLSIHDLKQKLGLVRPELSETAARQLQRDTVVDAFLEDVSAQQVEIS